MTWEDVEGVVHHGLSQPHEANPSHQIGLLTPCRGFLRGWQAHCLRPVSTTVTCILCHSTTWIREVEQMEHVGLLNADVALFADGTVLHTLFKNGAFAAPPWQ